MIGLGSPHNVICCGARISGRLRTCICMGPPTMCWCVPVVFGLLNRCLLPDHRTPGPDRVRPHKRGRVDATPPPPLPRECAVSRRAPPGMAEQGQR